MNFMQNWGNLLVPEEASTQRFVRVLIIISFGYALVSLEKNTKSRVLITLLPKIGLSKTLASLRNSSRYS